MAEAPRDQNHVPTMLFESSTNAGVTVAAHGDQATGRLFVDLAGGSGTVTSVSVVSANGFAGTVATATTTPAITLSTTITGVIKGNGTAISAATDGTDYLSSTTGLKLDQTSQQTVANNTPIFGSLTASQIVATDANKALQTLAVATYPSLTELSYVKGVTSAIQTQLNAKGTGTVTAIGVTTANGVSGSSSGGTTPNLTITLGAITPTTVNGLTISTTTGTFTLTNAKTLTVSDSFTLATSSLTLGNGKVLTVSNTLTLAGTDSTTMTFPSTSASIARTDAAQTFTGTQTFSQVITTANAIAASANAATVPVTSRHNIVTNSSAATLTITLTTASAVNMQTVVVQILDFSAAAQTITWVNTENSTVSAPTTSNGSTSLPLTVGFMYNSSTSKWRCIASA